ncbi:hypothetical protein BHM03_00024893 [Ensete ventricosum]|nr:hypothetical protein BHM03_00024893 [Ensete ventricosum]
MGARGFFVRAQGMYRLLRTLAGRPRTQAIVSYLSQLLVLGGAAAAQSLLRCFGGSYISSVGGLCLVGFRDRAFLFAKFYGKAVSAGIPVAASTKCSSGLRGENVELSIYYLYED